MKADLHQWCLKTNRAYSFRTWMLFFIKDPAFRRLLDYRIKTSGIKILKLFRPFTFFSSLHLNLLILSDKSTKGIGGDYSLLMAFQQLYIANQWERIVKFTNR